MNKDKIIKKLCEIFLPSLEIIISTEKHNLLSFSLSEQILFEMFSGNMGTTILGK